MQDIRDFLNKVLTSQSITKEMREEALNLRDQIDKLRKNIHIVDAFAEIVDYPGDLPPNVKLNLSDIKEMEKKCFFPDGRLRKIEMIKKVRDFYNMQLKPAKFLVDWLQEKDIITERSPSLY